MTSVSENRESSHPNNILSQLDDSQIPVKDSSIFFEDKYEEEEVLLKFARSRPMFLIKVGLHFMIYYGVLVGVIALIHLKPEIAEKIAEDTKIAQHKWIVLMAIGLVKAVPAFFGMFMRKFSKVLFLADIVLSSWALLGFYFFFHGSFKDLYSTNTFYFYLILADLEICTVAFIVTALFKDNNRIYSYWTGILGMNFANFLCIVLTNSIFFIPGTSTATYGKIFLAIAVYNIYFAINAYFVVNYRTKKFYHYEHIYCFFCFFVDWFSFFWWDTIRGRVKRMRINRAQQIEATLEAKREEKRQEKARSKKYNRNSLGKAASDLKPQADESVKNDEAQA